MIIPSGLVVVGPNTSLKLWPPLPSGFAARNARKCMLFHPIIPNDTRYMFAISLHDKFSTVRCTGKSVLS